MKANDAPAHSVRGIIQRIGAPESPPPWSFLDVTNAISVLFISIIFAGQIIAALLFSGALDWTSIIIGWVLGGALTVAFVVLTRRRRAEAWAALRLETPGISLSFVLLFGIGAAITLDLIGLAATGSILPPTELSGAADFGLITWVVVALFLVVVQPAAEELVYRGVAFPWLAAKLGVWGGLLVTSLLYAGFHLIMYPAEPGADTLWHLLLPFLAGLMLGGIRAYTGSTRAAIVAHAGMGLFTLLGALLLVT